YDLLFGLRGPRAASDRVAIVAIDEKTLERHGRWPLGRDIYARALARLESAAAVGIDLIFTEPSSQDESLGQAISAHGRVVLPAYIDMSSSLARPLGDFRAARIGHAHLEQDADGVVRTMYHSIYHQDQLLPSFASQLFVMLPGTQFEHRLPEHLSAGRFRPRGIFQTDRMGINYCGPQGTFETVSMADLLDGRVQPQIFKDRIVLIGVTADGILSGLPTPYSGKRSRFPEVEIHANSLNTLLQANPVRSIAPGLGTLLVVVLGGLGLVVFARVNGLRAILVLLVGLLLVLAASFFLFSGFNRWLAPAAPVMVILVAFVLAYIYNLQRLSGRLQVAKYQWESSFNTIDDAVLIHDLSGKIVRANQALTTAFNPELKSRLEERCRVLMGRSGGLKQNPGSGDWPQAFEYDLGNDLEIGQGAQRQIVEVKSLPQFDAHRRYQGMVQIARDITARRQADEERRVLQTQLIEAQKMEAIGTLAGGIAHDFNNILSGIMGYTELSLMDLKGDGKLQDNLREILKAGERARDLVQQILTFSRRADPEHTLLRLDQVVEDGLKLLKSILPSTIAVTSDIKSPSVIQGDATQCHQIIMNLGTNAYHAMQPEGGTLSVSLVHFTLEPNASHSPPNLSPGEYVLITVKDTGGGIAPDTSRRIFEPYYTTKSIGKGTGLGLAVVHGIVKDLDGAITMESSLGQGTTFSVYLPRVSDAPQVDQTEQEAELRSGSGHILFVDDSPELVQIGGQMLTHLGYQVTSSTSSNEVFEIFSADPDRYDALITDMTMPEMTGDRLAQMILSIRPDLPIILCTGYHQGINQETAVALGIRRLLMKPIKIDVLAEALHAVLPSDETDAP
ncbi:MAG: CHASE2 domain-containing protein, partial [Desulfobacterales bacterium]